MIVNNAPQLIVQAASADTRRFELLEHAEWTVGRDRANLIQIFDRYASRFHGVLGIFEDRHVYFRDLNSRNGTLMDGQPVTEPVLLKHGDRITIGNTALVLKHSYVTTIHSALRSARKQALMIHASAIQGKIWQEILLSQGIDVLWEVPGAQLQQIIGLQATANLLPPLLIIDIQSVKEDIYGLCHWCRQQGLSVQILLIDSSRSDIPDSEQAYITKLGFLSLFPALPAGQLFTRRLHIFEIALSLLTAFQEQTLNREPLSCALQTLDQLFSQAPMIISTTRQAELDAMNSEDLTSLKVDPRKVGKSQLR
jgi:pSer/pThr/pTyr-binding forkhead associated (FHA) protein